MTKPNEQPDPQRKPERLKNKKINTNKELLVELFQMIKEHKKKWKL